MEPLNLDLLKSIPIPADIRVDALALEGRVERLRKKTIACYVAAGIGAILGLTGYGLSMWLSPDIYISSAHIPEGVLKVFSDSVMATSGASAIYESMAQKTMSFLRPLAMIFGIGAMVVGIGVGIVKGSIAPIVLGMTMAVTSSLAPGIIGSVTDGVQPAALISEKRQLIQMVEGGDINGVDQAFKAHKVAGSLGDYVLAQTMLIRKKMEVDDKRVKTFDGAKFKELVLRVDQKAQDISSVISPEVLMTLEVQALGKTQSAIAKQYEKNVLTKVSLVSRLEGVIKYLSFAFMFLGVMLLAFKTVMQRRVIKIAGLLNQHSVGKVDQHPENLGMTIFVGQSAGFSAPQACNKPGFFHLRKR